MSREALMQEISSKVFREKISDILSSVFYTNEKYVLTRNGKKYAVIISVDLWNEMQKTQCKADLQ